MAGIAGTRKNQTLPLISADERGLGNKVAQLGVGIFSGVEQATKSKGEPDHAVSPLHQEQITSEARKIAGGVEQSDRN
jgi:hypothetical protein